MGESTSPPVCQQMVMKVYESVINHTIDSCYNLYADDGLDKTVLDELKHIWLNKLKQSTAIKLGTDKPDPNPPAAATASTSSDQQQFSDLNSLQSQSQQGNNLPTTSSNIQNDRTQFMQQQATSSSSMVVPLSRQTISNIPMIQQQNRASNLSIGQIPRIISNNVLLLTPQQQQRILAATSSSSNTSNQGGPSGSGGGSTVLVSNASDPARLVAVQIMLPGNRTVHIQVPQIILSEKRLPGILTGPVIQSTMGMTDVQASNYLQQHINSSYQNQIRATVLTRIINQLDGQFDSDSESSSFQMKKIKKEKKHKHRDLLHKRLQEQDDDLNGTEDDDDDLSTSESELSDDVNENDENNDSGESIIGIEETLNSGDDISDEESEDIFDTENVIVCQYEKVIRNRNKWRFTLKDGIMHILGKDYVFNRTFGWGDW